MLKQMEGSRAVAEAVALCRPEVICAYPISPQTHIVEALGEMVKEASLVECEYINVESEFAAMSVAIGASAAGARSYTATASQGLLFMAEAVYNASGLGLPIVMTVANRAIGAPINIWNDHSDAMSQRDCGWIQLFAETNQEATDLHLGALGLLRVGVSPLYIQKLFVPAFVQLHRQRPAATVCASLHLNDELWRLLRQGELDLTLSSLPALVPEDLQTLALMRDDLCMVVRAGHPLLERKRLKLADLAEAQWMLPGPDVAARRHVEARLAQAGLPAPRIALEVSNTAGQMRQILRETDLVSLMSESMLGGDAGKGLAVLPLAQARVPRAVGITWLKGAPRQPLATRFVELLQQTASRQA